MDSKLGEKKTVNEPKVSIVITTFKGMDTLERAIQSCVSQTYANTEIIVVDDNGLGTPEQAATAAIVRKFPEVVYIPHEKNRNGSAARNTGISAASGEFISLLDDDDAYRPFKIEKQMHQMLSDGGKYKICYTGMQIHFPDGREVEQIQKDCGNIFPLVIKRKIHAPSSVLLFSKEAALHIGGFDERFQRHQDWEFLDRMAYRFPVAVVPEVCMDRYIYKRNAAANPERYEKNRLFYLSQMASYIDTLPQQERKEIYRMHYRSICKEYVKSRKLLAGMKYFLKCGNPARTAVEMLGQYRKE